MIADIITPIVGAVSAIVAAIIVVILKAALPGSKFVLWLTPKQKQKSLIAKWDSAWGEWPNGTITDHEVLEIYNHRGNLIFGTATRPSQPNKSWEVRGRYYERYLQMYFYPSPGSKFDFDDYGCYLLLRERDGTFSGVSVNFGKTSADYSIDRHELKKI